MSLQFELRLYHIMCEGAGGKCPPHFEKLRVAKLIPPFGIELKKKAFYLE